MFTLHHTTTTFDAPRGKGLLKTFMVTNIFFFSYNVFHSKKDKFNPLPDRPILGSSNSVANKDMM